MKGMNVFHHALRFSNIRLKNHILHLRKIPQSASFRTHNVLFDDKDNDKDKEVLLKEEQNKNIKDEDNVIENKLTSDKKYIDVESVLEDDDNEDVEDDNVDIEMVSSSDINLGESFAALTEEQKELEELSMVEEGLKKRDKSMELALKIDQQTKNRGDYVDKRTKDSIAVKCQLIAERCKEGHWVGWDSWADVAWTETLDECLMDGKGWQTIDLPPDPRLTIPKNNEFYEVMQDAATAIAKNTYYDPERKVQVLRQIYLRLQKAQYYVKKNPKEFDYIGYTDPDQLNRILRIEHSPWKKFVEHNPPEDLITPKDQREIDARSQKLKKLETTYRKEHGEELL
jgi:hypothetical protein